MSRTPKPWWRKERRSWFVMLDGRQVNLGPDRGQAFRKFHQLMTEPRAKSVTGDSVLGVIDAYLDRCSKHRTPDTYRWYHDRLQEFARTIDPGLTTDSLRPFHIQKWIDSREGWSDGSRRNGIRAVKRVFRWAEEQGYIDRSPVAYMKKPKGGKREVIVSQAEFDDILSLARDEGFRDLLAPKYCLYALRHTWMNRLLTSGVDGLTVAILAGHKDPSMLARHYQHLSLNPKHLLEQAKKAAG